MYEFIIFFGILIFKNILRTFPFVLGTYTSQDTSHISCKIIDYVPIKCSYKELKCIVCFNHQYKLQRFFEQALVITLSIHLYFQIPALFQ